MSADIIKKEGWLEPEGKATNGPQHYVHEYITLAGW